MKNADIFAAFASKLFPLLYNGFPVPMPLPQQLLVDELENQDELWELRRRESESRFVAEALEVTGQMTPEWKERAVQKQSEYAVQIDEKKQKLQLLDAVFEGTVAFLESEGFIRSADDGKYQLTLKGFVHLNMRFDQVGIQDGKKHIDRLLDLLRPDKFTGAVTSGTLASLIAQIFAGG